MAKKQTKADKAFIKKISTVNIGTGAGKKPKAPSCPGCGGKMVGIVAFPVYTGDVKAESERRRKQSADEDSFAA